ncbi:hypothetical protein Tco_0718887 [Tanacetum coccineum]
MQPVAPPSPDYIPGPEDPQTPPVPQDKDEREPMFVHAHDPDYMSEPIYPKYIPLEDEHEFPTEEQPLPPVDSPTAESPRYVTESDHKEDPEEYEDDETEDDDEENAGGHLDLADSAIVFVPRHEPITVWPQTSISLPPEAEVERLLALTTPSPSPPISLSPPSAGERFTRIASTQALVDAVTAALPSPPLLPLPLSLYIPSLLDRMDDIPKSEQPPSKRLYLFTLGSRYEVGESSTARPTRGQEIDYGFVSTVDAKERR